MNSYKGKDAKRVITNHNIEKLQYEQTLYLKSYLEILAILVRQRG